MTPSDAIELLRSAGMTEAAIGVEVGTGQTTIHRIRHGRDPRWVLGNALIALAQSRQRTHRKNKR